MIRPISRLLAVSAIAISLFGCSSEEKNAASTSGKISPFVQLLPDAVTSQTSRATYSDITASDLTLKLVSDDGSVNRTFNSVDDFPTNEEFKTGKYTLSAFYGDKGTEGFEKPYFYGEQKFDVKANETTSVSLTSSLANTMVTVSYTEAFRNYMSSYNAILHSAGGEYNFYGPTETRPIYLNPGQVTLLVRVVKNNGTEARLEVASFTAEPRHHYRFTVDVNNGEVGNPTLVVTLDEQLGREDVIIDLSESILNAPAPTITTEGFASGDVIEAIGATKPADNMKMNVVARGGIRSVKLTTESEYLLMQAWPQEVDLAIADEIMQSRLKAFGLSTLGIWNNPDQMGVIDFTEVVAHIKYSPLIKTNTSKFTLVVTDRQGKTSEPATFIINTIRATLILSNPSVLPIGETSLSVDVEFNGSDIRKNVIFEYRNDRGTFSPLTVADITELPEANKYRVTLTVPNTASDLIIRARYNDTESQTITVKHIVPEYELGVDERDVFSTTAMVEVKCTEIDPASIATICQFYVSTDGGATWQPTNASRDGAFVKLSRLTPSTSYMVRAIANGTESKVQPSFTTEAQPRLQNGSMGDWDRIDGQTSYWWVSFPRPKDYATIGYTPMWDTMNQLTTSEGGKNTSWINRDGCAYSAISGTISTKIDDSNLGGYIGQGALIRTVGWGGGNGATATSGMGTCQHITPGELYLGHFDTGSKQAVYGVDWKSRPSGLKFWYKYEPHSADDVAYAEISVTDADGKSHSKTIELAAESNWTEITLPLNYPKSTAKANKLTVKFKSSNIVRDDKQFINTTYLTPPPPRNTSDGTYMGSQLYIDEIELIY